MRDNSFCAELDEAPLVATDGNAEWARPLADTGSRIARHRERRANAVMKTAIIELLGIRYPIVQGGMMWIGRAELASAVSNAGGLGILTALTQPTPDELCREIDRCRAMTPLRRQPDKSPPYADYARAIIDSGVRVVETAGNVPREFFHQFKTAGIKIVHKCVAVRHALSAERAGVDAVSIDGFECAGHPGEEDVPNMVLIPAALRTVKIPIIASGGIGNGRGMAAALALSAQGVNMGTRFMVTREAPLHDNIKQALVNASERDTTLLLRTMNDTSRVYSNSVARQVVEIERRLGGARFEDVRPLVAGLRGKEAYETGDIERGVIAAGLVIGLIDDVPSCAELIERMVTECRAHLRQALGWFDAGPRSD